MKVLSNLLALLILFTVVSCNPDEDILKEEHKYSFQIMRVKESMNAEFIKYFGRVKVAPVGGVLVSINAQNETIVFQEYISPVPDVIDIPSLASGSYKIYIKSNSQTNINVKEVDIQEVNSSNADNPITWPIFAGFADILLESEGQLVDITMENISINIITTFVSEQTFPINNFNNIDVTIRRDGGAYYYETKTFAGPPLIDGFDTPVIRLNDAFNSAELFHVPAFISYITLSLYSKSNTIVYTSTINFDPTISLSVNQQIIFEIDIDKVANAASGVTSSGTLNWNVINWDQLQPVIIP